jgi:O-acetylhomoserine (thiol)-lyase
MVNKAKGFTSRILHAEYLKKDSHNSLQMPIYNNASFEFETAEQMELTFQGRTADHSYSRISNPTVENFEQRIKVITGALNVTALSSGMAAISNTFFTIASAGSNIVTSKHLFGNTYVFLHSTIAAFGVEIRVCDLSNLSEVEKATDENTCAIFFETITNPQLEIVDIRKLADLAHSRFIPLVADSTLTPMNIFRASDFGVDIEVVSSTKCISGGATSIGGLIIDYGKFDWSHSAKLKAFAKKFGPFAFNAKLRKEVFRNLGACMSPQTAYLQSLGLETLKLRFDKASANCLALAKQLKDLDQIVSVNYPGLPDSEFYSLAVSQFGEFPGALLTFELHSKGQAFQFINKLKIIKRSTNLYDNKTLIIHPATTIFCEFDPLTRESIGVGDALIRLSVGIEDVEDLITDIQSALN